MPVTAAAFDAGVLSYEKVRLLARARTDATAGLFVRDEPMLVDRGRVLDADQFAKVVRYWLAMADAAAFATHTNATFDGRSACASELLDGMLKVDALFDPETSRVVKGVLDGIVDEFRQADRRDTANGVGVAPRTHRQLLADAFGEMARRAAASTSGTGRRSRPEMMVLVPADVFTDTTDMDAVADEDDPADRTDRTSITRVGTGTAAGNDGTGIRDGTDDAAPRPGTGRDRSTSRDRSTGRGRDRSTGSGSTGCGPSVGDRLGGGASGLLPTLDNGVPITADAARRLACNAVFRRVVLGAASEILDLGRSTPVPSAAQRRAVMLRDGGCTFAGCDMPTNRCEVHHLIHYHRGSDTGGPTDLHNLTLVCRRHHHLAHEGGYTMTRNRVTGTIETHRPDHTLIPTRPRAGPLHPYRRPDHDDPGDQGLPRAS